MQQDNIYTSYKFLGSSTIKVKDNYLDKAYLNTVLYQNLINIHQQHPYTSWIQIIYSKPNDETKRKCLSRLHCFSDVSNE